MANIELRDYIAEIEQMLAAENNSEAVAHCRHILDYFPKNLAIYRLLGKGLLEQRQFADAANVFYRVLSAAPDDFVAHLGLAIIGEEEGNLTQSIGHMARAFETQPNNAAIQEELKRLYGRRDGVAPSRIRLTRGGLARLYVNGGNHAQAVEELRAALNETPERIDLQILLAKALWYDEQRIDAVQVCQGILQRLPYSLEANAILYEIWQSTDREEEAMLYRQRVEALDPFLAQELGSRSGGRSPKLEIPRLDYVPTAAEEIMGVPEWVKDLGLHFDDQEEASEFEAAATPFDATAGAAAEVVPDWLRDMVPSGEESQPTESGHDWEAEKALEEAVPTWLRDAGLLEDGEGEPVIEFDEPEDEAAGVPAGAQDEPLPGWLTDAVEWESKKKEESEQTEGVPSDDWLLELDVEEPDQAGEAAPAAELDELPSLPEGQTGGFGDLSWDRVEEQLGIKEEEPAPEPPEDLTAADEFPFDWQDLESEEVGRSTELIEPEVAPERIEESAMPQSNKDEFRAPGEGGDLGEMPSDPEEAMKWLERLAASQGAPLEELPSLRGDEELAPAEDMPAWLKEIAAASGHTPGPVQEETDGEELGLPDWLQEDVFTPTPAEPAQPRAAESEDDFDLPDWLKEEFGEDEEKEPRAAARPADTLPKDSDEAMAWLEELASSSEEAASEEIEEPEIPDWLKAELPEEGEEAEQLTPEAKGAAEAKEEEMPEDIDEAMAWLESLAARQGAPLEELTSYEGDESAEVDLPDWLKAEFEAADVKAEPELEPFEEEEELPDWLREPEEEPTPAAEAEEPEIPDWLREAVAVEAEEKPAEVADEELELPAWLREEAIEAVEIQEAEVAEEEEELPDWLREEALAEEPPVAEIEATEAEVELPDWLREEPEEAVEEAAPAEVPVSEEETGLPEWLTEEIWEESAELAEDAEIEPALVEEELELPDWLRDEFYEEPAEPAEAELVAEIEEAELELPEWLHAEAEEEVVIAGESVDLLEEEAEVPAVGEEAAEGEIEAVEEAPTVAAMEEVVEEAPEPVAVKEVVEEVLEAVEVEEAEAIGPEEAEIALVEEPEAVVSEEAAEVVAEAVVPEPEEEAPVGIAAFREQLAEEPDDYVTRLALARALVDDQNWDEALSQYGELISASQELEEVIEDLDQLLESQPRSTKAQSLLGDAYMKRGDLGQALEAYRRALSSL